MKKGVLFGATYGILLILLSQYFIQNVSGVFSLIGKMVMLDGEIVAHIAQILEQLKTAKITSPWLFVLLLGIGIGILYFWVIRSVKHKVLISQDKRINFTEKAIDTAG